MNRKGFTLIELLVSISIFGLLSSFIVANYRSNEKLKILKNQAQLIVDGLEKTQNMSLTGETVNGLSPLSYRFEVNDCHNDCAYQIRVETANEELLASQLRFNNLNIKTFNANGNLAVVFVAPRAKMTLSNEKIETWLELSNQDDNYYCVKINSISGRIEALNGTCQ